ncbi:hypothetical protein KSF_027230 [Reticulibacter mediterranei]|uniref:Cytochrome P450 n=1 Tax=Reticulibacter mediterranei TaxID=2778369 RepID=A0A8J3IHT1_9CHLR|nr:hypothetical protein [Reticulibacter mediterranei]GHO92675.1 hypothetical protein KSF_027230 [Reticulibacter mediterranei]
MPRDNDYQTFSSEPSNGGPFSIIALDPPRHRQLRSLITPAFSARTILQQTPRIQRIACELLEAALVRGVMDMVADFAVPFPILVIADLLGLPPDNSQQVKEWTDTLINQSSSEVAQWSGRNASSALPLDEISRALAQALKKRLKKPSKNRSERMASEGASFFEGTSAKEAEGSSSPPAIQAERDRGSVGMKGFQEGLRREERPSFFYTLMFPLAS